MLFLYCLPRLTEVRRSLRRIEMIISIPVVESQLMTRMPDQIVVQTVMITTMSAMTTTPEAALGAAPGAASAGVVVEDGTTVTDTATGPEIEIGPLRAEAGGAALAAPKVLDTGAGETGRRPTAHLEGQHPTVATQTLVREETRGRPRPGRMSSDGTSGQPRRTTIYHHRGPSDKVVQIHIPPLRPDRRRILL